MGFLLVLTSHYKSVFLISSSSASSSSVFLKFPLLGERIPTFIYFILFFYSEVLVPSINYFFSHSAGAECPTTTYPDQVITILIGTSIGRETDDR